MNFTNTMQIDTGHDVAADPEHEERIRSLLRDRITQKVLLKSCKEKIRFLKDETNSKMTECSNANPDEPAQNPYDIGPNLINIALLRDQTLRILCHLESLKEKMDEEVDLYYRKFHTEIDPTPYKQTTEWVNKQMSLLLLDDEREEQWEKERAKDIRENTDDLPFYAHYSVFNR